MEPESSAEVASVTESVLSYRALTILTVLLVAVVGTFTAVLPARGDASSTAERTRVCAQANRIEAALRLTTTPPLAHGDVTPAVLAAYDRAARRSELLAGGAHPRSPRLVWAVRGMTRAYRSGGHRLAGIRAHRPALRQEAIVASLRAQRRETSWALYYSCGPTFR